MVIVNTPWRTVEMTASCRKTEGAAIEIAIYKKDNETDTLVLMKDDAQSFYWALVRSMEETFDLEETWME